MSKTYFLHQPNGIFLRSKEQLLHVGEQLEIGTYSVDITPQGEFYLVKADSFTRPPKLYGNVQKKAEHILTTFKDRSASTGVLLSGEQGSGKTMLARELSIMGAKSGIATILVGKPFCGPDFNLFMQAIDVPCVVIFDEFEKMYDDDDQEKMLTLLDGVYPTKKLFVLTCNNLWRVDKHILNRPGRLFYHLKYNGLEHAFIEEYCEEKLTNKAEIPAIVKIASMFYAFNFDMLKALVEEMNRFGFTAMQAVEMLNISPERSPDNDFKVELYFDGKKAAVTSPAVFDGNPLDGKTFDIAWVCGYDSDDTDGNETKKAEKTAKLSRSA